MSARGLLAAVQRMRALRPITEPKAASVSVPRPAIVPLALEAPPLRALVLRTDRTPATRIVLAADLPRLLKDEGWVFIAFDPSDEDRLSAWWMTHRTPQTTA